MNKNKAVVGVLDAIKGRGGVGGAKKGVQLLDIVQKLTDKRKAQSEEVEEKKEKETVGEKK